MEKLMSKAKEIPKRLSINCIAKLRKEYEKEAKFRSYKYIIQKMGNLKFFKKFPFEIKEKLIRSATYKHYQKNEVIFT